MRLRDVARRLGVEPQALAATAVIDFLNRQEPDFNHAAEHVLEKNRDLYTRLS